MTAPYASQVATLGQTDRRARPVAVHVARVRLGVNDYLADFTQTSTKSILIPGSLLAGDVSIRVFDVWVRVVSLFSGGATAAVMSIGTLSGANNDVLHRLDLTSTGVKDGPRGPALPGYLRAAASGVLIATLDAGAGALASDLTNGAVDIFIAYCEVNETTTPEQAPRIVVAAADPGEGPTGGASISGVASITSADSPYTVPADIAYLEVDGTGGVAITLAPATSPRRVSIKRTDATLDIVDVTPDGAETVDNVAGAAAILAGESWPLWTSGSGNWNRE